MEKHLSLAGTKDFVFNTVEKFLRDSALTVIDRDFNRPWGGYFVLDENQAEKFAALFFPDVKLSSLKIGDKLSPKILMVQPNKRLSWQYHHRRAEIWKLVSGIAGVVTSETDQEGPLKTLKTGEVIQLCQGMRHRLVGLNGWGMVAEIWQHTDINNPSDENDIVRLQDDFGR